MKKLIFVIITVLLAGTIQVSGQSLNFKIGLFNPEMRSDLWDVNMENLYLSKEDMQDIYMGVEYEHFLGRYFSFALEGGMYSRTVYSSYRDYVYDDDSLIFQNIYLSMSGIEADIKFYPMGHRRYFNPYIGGGIGVYLWKYEQWGDFLDFTDWSVSEGYAYTETWSAGLNVKGGFIYRFIRRMGLSFEAKYQYLKGELSSYFEGFEKFDLSGLTINVGLNLYFR